MSTKLTISGSQLFKRMDHNFIAFKLVLPPLNNMQSIEHLTDLLNYRIERFYSVNNKFTGELSKKKNGV